MGTKEKLLALFEADKGKFFSGEELAARLAVSRTAVWKAVNSLRKEGYEIQAVRNKGYSLSVSTDILSIQGVEKYLNPEHSYIELEILPDIGSTNDYLREKAKRERVARKIYFLVKPFWISILKSSLKPRAPSIPT